jgi:phage terminase small subunit
MKKLTDKQQAFITEYMVDRNASAAAVRAGYSARSSDSRGCRLLKEPHIAAEVARLTKEREQRTEINAEYVMAELRTNVDLARDAGHIAASNQALQLLGKHLGMFVDRLEVDASHEVEIDVTWNGDDDNGQKEH